MSVLHTISKSPASGLLDQCLSILQPNDSILFIEDGIYHQLGASELVIKDASNRFFSLKEDVLARGLSDVNEQSVTLVSTQEFVQLCVDHDKVVNWF